MITGNLVGIYKSSTNASKKILIGSHIDTVAYGGKYDGIAGVISGLSIIKYLSDNDIELPFDIEVYDYLGEELIGICLVLVLGEYVVL